MRRFPASVALAALLLTAAGAPGGADVLPPERFSGYTLEYGFSWNGIPAAAGKATLTSTPADESGAAHRLDAESWTLPLLRLLWPARNSVHAAVATDLSSRRFQIHREERRKEQSTDIRFDPATGEVQIVRKKTNGKVKELVLPLEGLRDPLSLAYVLRQQPTTLGTTYESKVVVSDDVYRVSVAVVAKGTTHLGDREVPTVCVVPRVFKIEDDGTEEPIEKLQSARIWVTDDALRLPVRVKARAFIGRVVIALHTVSPSLDALYAAVEAGAPLVADAAAVDTVNTADQPG